MDVQEQLGRLERANLYLKAVAGGTCLLAVIAVAVAAVALLRSRRPAGKEARFGTVLARRICVVDEEGKSRLILSSGALLLRRAISSSSERSTSSIPVSVRPPSR